MESLEQIRDPAFQAGKLGFKVGAVVVKKKKQGAAGHGKVHGCSNPKAVAEPDDRLYTIRSVQDGKWNLEVEEDGFFVWVNTKELIAEWSVTKRQVQGPLPGYTAETRCCPLSSKQWAIDFGKAVCTIALREAYTEHKDASDCITYVTPPLAVKAVASRAKGTLQLFPASQNILLKPSSVCPTLCLGQFDVGPEPFRLYLAHQIVLPLNKDNKPNECPWLAPFWTVWTTQSNEQKPPNMELKWKKCEVHGNVVHVPFFINACNVNYGDILSWDKAAAEEPPHKKHKTHNRS